MLSRFMVQPKAILSEKEEKFELFRQRAGFVLAPLIFLGLWFLPFQGLTPEAHRLLAVLGLVVTLWMTEAIPMAITALLGPTLCVVVGIGSAKSIYQSFADPIIFLFLGSFLLAEAMLHHGLNRRIAFQILGVRGVGSSPFRLLLAFGFITGFLSMWVSNTATTAMMFPIGIAILSEMARQQSQRTGKHIAYTELKFGTGLMLLAAFAASVGGLATPVGTPPNLIGVGMLQKYLNLDIPFFKWMLFGAPLAISMIAFLVFYFHRVCPADSQLLGNSEQWISAEKAKLGRWSRGEWNVMIAFCVTVLLWVLPGAIAFLWGTGNSVYQWFNQRLPEASAALVGAALLFFLPVNFKKNEFTISWNEAKRIDWGTILLFGGGLALGNLMFSTGLAQWIGEGLAGAFEAQTTLGLVVLFTLVAIFVSETTSNTASATMVIPVAIAVAQAAGVDPVQPALAACLGASMGFMLPVSTPPNAIVYGSGCVPLMKMVRYGILLDLVGCALIVGIVMWLVPKVL